MFLPDLPLAPLCLLQWVPVQLLLALAIFGLMETGFGTEEPIPGGMVIGQIHRLVTNGSRGIGDKNQEASIGNLGGGANAVYAWMGIGVALFPSNFSRSSL